MELSTDKQATGEIREKLEQSKFKEAFQILKRNPMSSLSRDDARLFLNNIESLNPNLNEDDNNQKQIMESANFIFKRLERQNVLRGFGSVDGEYPERSLDISPLKLEELTGLKMTALTPKQRTTYWRLAGISLCLVEYLIGSSLGIDPLYTLIPLTIAGFITDQILLKGAIFETAYQTLIPEYRMKIISHEAGHFLIAYLLGLSIRGCITNAWEARKYSDIRGQAGTIFYDSKLADEITKQKVAKSSLDRLSVVIMAGIAAEAIKYDKSEGGVVDEQTLVSFLSSVQPPWNIMRIQGQARWAVLQAILLVREHQASYNALVEVLARGGGVGDAVLAIEDNLPATLPSLARIQEREERKKKFEKETLLRYVQRLTWKVGGVLPVESGKSAKDSIAPSDLLSPSSNAPLTLPLPSATTSTTTDNDDAATRKQAIDEVESAVGLFSKKIKILQEAVKRGDLPLEDKSHGGLWLNDLKSRESPSSTSSTDTNIPLITAPLPTPLPGYEDRIKALQEKEKQEQNTTTTDQHQSEDTTSATGNTGYDLTAMGLLGSRRGFQVKLLENQEAENIKKISEIESRLVLLKKEIAVRETATPGGSNRVSRW